QSLSLSAGAVVYPSTITVIKDAVPNSPQDFNFTTTGTGLSDFSLDDDADPTLSNTRVFSGITDFGQKTITEAAVAGWDLTGVVITEDRTQNSTANLGTRTSTISLEEGENVIITYTNTQRGRIIVEKQTNPDGSVQSFNFAANYGSGSFSLTDNGT